MLRVLLLFMCFVTITYQGTISRLQILSRSKRQSENYCVLPDHPKNGKITILGQEQEAYLPNSNVILNTIINLSCGNRTVTETGGLSRAICYQGQWKPTISQMGRCVRKCPQMSTKSDTLSVTCKHRNPRINCDNPIEGTVAQVICKPFYEYVGSPSITCRDGTWDNVISSCRPECGKKRVSVQPLIIGGSTAIKSEYPWVAGIYKLNKTEFYGGATIISPQLILSAAHLLTNGEGDPLDTNNFIVSVGKFYSGFNDTRDINMQSRRIKRLYIPENFRGRLQNYGGDFAIITLEDPLILSEYVQPVCIDWTNQDESSSLKEGNKGTIAGWGFAQVNGTLADELQTLDVPYESRDTCSVPLDFKKLFYTFDKFCAGYIDEQKAVCAGDSGGGLFFQNADSRFYIRGILSVAPRDAVGCDTGSSALYTKISTYLQKINEEAKLVEK